ncbi:DNA ligase D [Chryseobacterium sp. GP-SGM7]|uniref:DNA ligase D n=1 Tax=Chryseobacterium sp. GP-SGM7 TaxID=3411323 RepID=UPI003B92C26B
MALKDYNKKRKFDATSEPKGKTKKSDEKLIFVIQRHAASRLHYDFRLEMEGVLKSWAVPKGPSLNPEDKRLAMMVEDHPYDYKDFEGNIPEGNYGAGQVEVWDSGTYEPLDETSKLSDEKELLKELKAGSLKFILHGKKLKGEFALVKMKNAENNAWLLIKHKDKFAKDEYDAEENTAKNSQVTKFLEEKKKPKKQQKEVITSETKPVFRRFNSLVDEKKLENYIKPMLAKLHDKPFDDEDWVFEIKWDGYRAIADLSKKQPLFYSRNGISFLSKFNKIAVDFENQKHKMILDGEIVAYDENGKPSFQFLQQIGENSDLALTYQVFDLLWLNGHSTEELPLIQRKELLKDALIETDVIKYCDHIPEKGIDFFEQMKKMQLEGMIAKKSDSVYNENSRSSDWLKIKFTNTEEAIICGFTEPRGSREGFGALILGKHIDGKLIYAGHTGTGFNKDLINEIHERLLKLVTKTSPFENVPKTNMPVTWTKAELVCEIKFSEITKDGIFRHPVFVAIREDKNPEDLNQKTKEMKAKTSPKKAVSDEKDPEIILNRRKIKLTNQDKIYFPKDGVTKGEVIDYYQSVSKYILPHLKNRPLSLNRFPNGIEEMGFYQKDAGKNTPEWIKTTKVYSESTDKNIDYIYCNDKATLAYLNNLGCIDLNPWNSSLPDLENPDFLVLDLDPSKKNSFDDVIETALQINEVLKSIKIKGYCKTSGSTGIHIYIPMGGKYNFDQVKDFAHILMKQVNEKLPKLTTLERSLQKRDDKKIYLDYLQNRSGQTLASVYSIRPKESASVSMPLEWEELKKGLKPTDYTIHNALERIIEKGDLFKPVLGKGIDMMKALELLEGMN